jgi:hypothetical protein
MLQLAHQTLGAALGFSGFGAFTNPPGIAWFIRLLSEASHSRSRVIRLVPACVQRAGQHEFSRQYGLVRSYAFSAIKREQDRRTALSTPDP